MKNTFPIPEGCGALTMTIECGKPFTIGESIVIIQKATTTSNRVTVTVVAPKEIPISRNLLPEHQSPMKIKDV